MLTWSTRTVLPPISNDLASAEEGYDLFLLMVTNILDSNTRLLVVGEPKDVVEKAFDKKLEDDKMDLPGVVSRKKQVVPPLEAAF